MTYQIGTTSGHHDDPVLDLTYRPVVDGAPVEVFTLDSLVARTSRAELASPQRLDFDLFIIGTAGTGTHEVDFKPATVEPERVVHVRPGQVHRWNLDRHYQATLILLRPPIHTNLWSTGPRVFDVPDDDFKQLMSLAALAQEPVRPQVQSLRARWALRDLMVAFLQPDSTANSDGQSGAEMFVDFMRLLDTGDARRTVREVAATLGCSTRTLSRVCQAHGGQSPKRLIDDHLSVQAQRLLTVTDRSITEIAHDLRFHDVSHFTRFFQRLTGESPTTFRQAQQRRRSPEGSNPPATDAQT